jgi:hypothetical protein
MLARILSRPTLLLAGCYLVGCVEQTPSGATAAPGSSASAPINQGQLAPDASVGPDAGAVDDDASSPSSPQSLVMPPAAGPDGGAPDASSDNSADAADSQAPPSQCDLDGGCVSQCSNQTAVCAVQSTNLLCELQGFTGASTEVACGQRAVIGTACCGECGCVTVEVFFDGTYCWQGVPTCTVSYLTNQFLEPHGPGLADAGWVSGEANGASGQFTLGPPDAGNAPAGNSDPDGGAADDDSAVPGAGGSTGDDGGDDGDAGNNAEAPDAAMGGDATTE